MKLRPLQDWAVINPIDPGEETPGGITIPASARENPPEGIVMAIGPGRYQRKEDREKKKEFVKTTLKPGQRVIYKKYAAKEIDLDGEVITLVREDDVLGIVEEASQLAVKETFQVKEKDEMPVALKKKAEIALTGSSGGKGVSQKASVSGKSTSVKAKAARGRKAGTDAAKSVSTAKGKAPEKTPQKGQRASEKAPEKKNIKKTAIRKTTSKVSEKTTRKKDTGQSAVKKAVTGKKSANKAPRRKVKSTGEKAVQKKASSSTSRKEVKKKTNTRAAGRKKTSRKT